MMNLVDFDGDTWEKFKLSLYYQSGQRYWPVKVLQKLSCGDYLGIAKKDREEEILQFSGESGRCKKCGYGKVLMDLDSPWIDNLDCPSVGALEALQGIGYITLSILLWTYKRIRDITLSYISGPGFYLLPTIYLIPKEGVYFKFWRFNLRI